MEQVKQDISAGKKILFIIISVLAFVVLIEGLLSVYFYRQNGGESLASMEMIRTIGSKLSNDKDLFVFEPWVEYKQHDGFSSAQGTPVSYLSEIPGDTLDIYFFGGANLSGIDTQFINQYKEKFPRGISARIHNYGSSHYYSHQELVLLANLIQSGHRPDVLVFLDGINDFLYGIPSYQRQSYFSFMFRQYFNSGLRSKGKFTFLDTANALTKTPDLTPNIEFSDSLISNYTSNLKNIRLLADMIGAKVYFFCEPSPYYQSAKTHQTFANAQDVFSRFDYIYPKLQQMQDSIPGFTYIGDIGGQNDFTSDGSYTPSLNRKVAEKILSKLSAVQIIGYRQNQ
jgi:hypothetical protein